MTTPIDDDPKLLTVIPSTKAASGTEDELGEALTLLVEPTEHLDAHLSTPHLTDFADKTGDLRDENGLTTNPPRRIA